MSNSTYQPSFFIVPYRITRLPDLQLSYLKVYETIFQFWNHKQKCFLSNQAICERTGIGAERTVREALAYFEKHGELKRQIKGKKRYIIQPLQYIEVENEDVDNSSDICSNNSHGGANLPPMEELTCRDGGANLPHKNNKLSFKNINKSSFIENSKNVDKSDSPTVQPKAFGELAKTADEPDGLLLDWWAQHPELDPRKREKEK